MATAVKPQGATSLIVDPGIIYDWGAVATGVRIAFQIGQMPNVGLIPLVHKEFNLGPINWFVELAAPTFVVNGQVSIAGVVHTGVGF